MADRIKELLSARASCRGFQPEPLAESRLREVLGTAQQSASWCNIQPWRVWIVSGDKRDRLSTDLITAATSEVPHPEIAFPGKYPEPYQSHRRQCGKNLYHSMGVARDDTDGRKRAWLRNYELFDAPHLAIVCRDKTLGEYATLDVGVWLGTLLLAAQQEGIATCPMASIAAYPQVIRKHVSIGEGQAILFGIALGFADPEVSANTATTTRDALSANVTFES